MQEIRLSTIDNCFDPIDEPDKWLAEDHRLAFLNQRRDSDSMLALFSFTSDNFSDEYNYEEIERAIDDIIKHDFLGIYIKVKHEQKSKQ